MDLNISIEDLLYDTIAMQIGPIKTAFCKKGIAWQNIPHNVRISIHLKLPRETPEVFHCSADRKSVYERSVVHRQKVMKKINDSEKRKETFLLKCCETWKLAALKEAEARLQIESECLQWKVEAYMQANLLDIARRDALFATTMIDETLNPSKKHEANV